jgi:hypothetical protein
LGQLGQLSKPIRTMGGDFHRLDVKVTARSSRSLES